MSKPTPASAVASPGQGAAASVAANDAMPYAAMPGHLVRRMQQAAVAIFLQETQAFGITPVQYAALAEVHDSPGLDQRTLARAIGFDTSTLAGVIDRLEARGLMRRNASAQDRRVRLLSVTDDGRALLDAVRPSVLRAQQRMLEPLPQAERERFMRLLGQLVDASQGISRVAGDA